LAAEDRTRSEIRITVCPYFQELTPERAVGYAEAGVDAVAAMFFATSPDDVPTMLDALEPCIDAVAAR
jgi:hypothetical protein